MGGPGGLASLGPSYLHVPSGDEALAFGITGLEELLRLPQHGQLAWRLLLALPPLQVIQRAPAGAAPIRIPARSLGSADHSLVRGSHSHLPTSLSFPNLSI